MALGGRSQGDELSCAQWGHGSARVTSGGIGLADVCLDTSALPRGTFGWGYMGAEGGRDAAWISVFGAKGQRAVHLRGFHTY